MADPKQIKRILKPLGYIFESQAGGRLQFRIAGVDSEDEILIAVIEANSVQMQTRLVHAHSRLALLKGKIREIDAELQDIQIHATGDSITVIADPIPLLGDEIQLTNRVTRSISILRASLDRITHALNEGELSRFRSDVEEMDLRKLIEGPEVKGKVLFREHKPFLQLHEFPDAYSLFWPSNPEHSVLLRLIPEVLTDATSLYPDSSFTFTFSAIMGQNGGSPKGEELVESQVVSNDLSAYTDVRQFLDAVLPTSVSLYFEITISASQRLSFSLWTDTENTSIGEKETGVTARNGFPLPHSVSLLIGETSPELNRTANRDIAMLLSERLDLKTA